MAEANPLKAAIVLSGNRVIGKPDAPLGLRLAAWSHPQREDQEVIKRWATGKNFNMEEVSCIAMGDDACRYRIGKKLLEE